MASTTIFFPIAYLALAGQFKFKMSNGKIALLFIFCWPLVGFFQFLMGGTDEVTGFGFFVLLGVPLLVCLAVVFASFKLSTQVPVGTSIPTIAVEAVQELPIHTPTGGHTTGRKINRDKLQWLISGAFAAAAIAYGITIISPDYDTFRSAYMRRVFMQDIEQLTGKPFVQWATEDLPKRCAEEAQKAENDFIWGRDTYSRCIHIGMNGTMRLSRSSEAVPLYLRERGSSILLYVLMSAGGCWLLGYVAAKGLPRATSKVADWALKFKDWIKR